MDFVINNISYSVKLYEYSIQIRARCFENNHIYVNEINPSEHNIMLSTYDLYNIIVDSFDNITKIKIRNNEGYLRLKIQAEYNEDYTNIHINLYKKNQHKLCGRIDLEELSYNAKKYTPLNREIENIIESIDVFKLQCDNIELPIYNANIFDLSKVNPFGEQYYNISTLNNLLTKNNSYMILIIYCNYNKLSNNGIWCSLLKSITDIEKTMHCNFEKILSGLYKLKSQYKLKPQYKCNSFKNHNSHLCISYSNLIIIDRNMVDIVNNSNMFDFKILY